MDFVKKSGEFWRRQKWLMPAIFITSFLLTVAAIVFWRLRGFQNIDNKYAFCAGADIVSMSISTVLLYSCIRDNEGFSDYTRTFVLLISSTTFVLFTDVCCWIVQGIPELRIWNVIANVLNYIGTAALLFFFWNHVVTSLDLHGRFINIANLLMNILLVPTLLLCLINLFVPFYFSVDEMGVYRREPLFMFSQTYLAIGLPLVVIGFFVSKVSAHERLVTASFVLIPVANQFMTGYEFGLTTTAFPAMLISIVLIFGVIVSEREKTYASRMRELSMASAIQNGMLPDVFPPFPDKKEIDIYASMDAAKEVGGDFYDFFLIDDDHLALVIADVSGKGVPASLFMMSSKILIADRALMGGSPSEILKTVNDRICSNNKLELFVTVWLGILELSTGKLTCSNAGHEFPMLKKNGKFELYKDKHGFVVGGIAGIKYKDYVIQLEKGDSIFVYTDGVAEATNAAEELFGTDRLIEVLNSDPTLCPCDLLKKVRRAVDEFVGEAPQFDDLTMLCLTYKGNGR